MKEHKVRFFIRDIVPITVINYVTQYCATYETKEIVATGFFFTLEDSQHNYYVKFNSSSYIKIFHINTPIIRTISVYKFIQLCS